MLQTCSAATDNQACVNPDAGYGGGFCCGGVCMVGGPQNCGGCGVTCAADAVCDQGSCFPLSTCTTGDPGYPCALVDGGMGVCCAGACVNLGSDAMNCSGCGVACALGETCLGSSCSLECATSAECPAGFDCVADAGSPSYPPVGTCVSTVCSPTTEGDLCLIGADGSAGYCCGDQCVGQASICSGVCHICGEGDVCVDGTCLPSADCALGVGLNQEPPCLTDAGLIGLCCGSECIDVANDPLNCGECGNACAEGGICKTSCPPEGCTYGHSFFCVDEAGMSDLCGTNNPCPDGYACAPWGACISETCDGTSSYCMIDGGSGICCGLRCVIPSEDGGGCALCGSVCPAGSVCNGSGCFLPDGGSGCGSGLPCPQGTVCSYYGECDPILDCSSSVLSPIVSCVNGGLGYGTCCDQECTDVGQDPQNCGTCGNVCPSGICAYDGTTVGSGCLPAGPTDDCSATCAAGTICINGYCTGSACGIDAYPFCVAKDGNVGMCCELAARAALTCSDVLDDAQNCGLCGNACGAGQSCVAGSCTGFPSCGPGHMFEYCDLDAGPAFLCCPSAGCTNTFTDPANCGSCGNVCPPALSCVSGICQ